MDPMITPMLVGLGVNAIRTGVEASKTKGLKGAYDTAEAGVNPVDPNQMAFLNRLRTQEQRFRAGTDPSSAFAAQGVQQQGAQTQRNMLRAGGPGAVGNMLRAQQGVNQGMAGVGAQAANMGNQLLGMQGGVINTIADRVYDLQRDRRNQAMARMEQNRQNVWNGISGMTATLPGIAAGMGGAEKFAPNTQTMTDQINASLPANRAMLSNPYTPPVPNSPMQPPAPMFGPPAPQAPSWWNTSQAQQPSWYNPQ